MLDRLFVQRFKSLSRLEIDLGRVNVFIGANGSGKSNLLEALGVLSAAASGRVDDESLLRRGVRPGVPRLYKTAFPALSNVPHIRFGASNTRGASFEVTLWHPRSNPSPAWRFKTENLREDNRQVLGRTTTSAGKDNQEQGQAALKVVNLKRGNPALSLMNELRNFRIYCPNTPTLRGLATDVQSFEPVGLAGGRLPEAIKELIEAAEGNEVLSRAVVDVRELIDWAEGFSAAFAAKVPLSPSAARSPLVIQFVDRFMAEGSNKLTGYDASEGALYILFCAVLALHAQSPRCLAIDNVDQALNPRLARNLMTKICEWTRSGKGPRQWLITAHNPAVLDGLPLEDPSVRLFAVDRDNEGHTAVRRIDLATAQKKRPPDWTLSRMWMSGLLGAVPNV